MSIGAPPDIGDAARRRQALTERKAALSSRLAEIKHKMMGHGRIPNGEFSELSRIRADTIAQLGRIDVELAGLRRQAHAVAVAENEAKEAKKLAGVDGVSLHLIRSCLRLRDAWRAAAVDRTSTEAVRWMATTFADQLDQVLKTIPPKDGP